MLQLLVPNEEVNGVVARIVDEGNLHQQAIGAVYSSPCEHVYLGSEYKAWPVSNVKPKPATHELHENLNIIYCIASPQHSHRIAIAAINSGSHGPIVHYVEGRGLRDRLGWLRITKEPEKEVLMVIADKTDVEEVFDAMAKAGQLHLPGRGFMYRMPIDNGLFNLPSRVSHHHYAANMQQMIHAIDHLSGHTHWRDQAVVDISGGGKSVGLDFVGDAASSLRDQVSLTGIVNRDDLQELMDIMLDSGAPGLNISHARYVGSSVLEDSDGTRVNQEYSLLRCVTSPLYADSICTAIDANAESKGLKDLCILVQAVPRVATYVPGSRNFRRKTRGVAA